MATAIVTDSRESAQWNLFADWCAAVGEQALPTTPLTLARFLSSHPATTATRRRRVGVINAVHRRGGHRAPGEAEVVRDLLDVHRRTSRERRTQDASAAIGLLPDRGWPTALFARRDAMILALYGAGLSAMQIAALRLNDIREAAQPQVLEIHVGAEIRLAAVDSAMTGLAATQIYRRWQEVRRVQHQLPATRWVRWLLDDQPMPPPCPIPESLPLLTPLDRWGATPLLPTPLSAAAVSRIIADHLTGSAPAHKAHLKTMAAEEEEETDRQQVRNPVVLDPNVLARGLDARRRATELLDGISNQLNEVEARAETMLVKLLELLEGLDA